VSPPSRLRRVATSLLLGLALTISVGIGPARAHGDDGIMEIVTLESPTPLEVAVEVGIVYANDDDPAADATVTVTAAGPDGATVGPVEVPNVNDGLYATTFPVPTAGTWSISAASTEPAAEATGTVTVAAGESTSTSGPTTTGGATTTASDGPTSSSEAPTTEVPATTAVPEAPTEAADADEDGSDIAPMVLLGLLALVAIGAVVLLARRSRAEPAADGIADHPEPTDAGGGPDGAGGYDSGRTDGGGD
jgi:hypothetical protein